MSPNQNCIIYFHKLRLVSHLFENQTSKKYTLCRCLRILFSTNLQTTDVTDIGIQLLISSLFPLFILIKCNLGNLRTIFNNQIYMTRCKFISLQETGRKICAFTRKKSRDAGVRKKSLHNKEYLHGQDIFLRSFLGCGACSCLSLNLMM